MSNMITVQQIRRIAAEAMVDHRTVTRVYSGLLTRPLVRERVVTAAKKLKMPAPPPLDD